MRTDFSLHASWHQGFQSLKHHWHRLWAKKPQWLTHKILRIGWPLLIPVFMLMIFVTHTPTQTVATPTVQMPTDAIFFQEEMITALQTLVERQTQILAQLETLSTHWTAPAMDPTLLHRQQEKLTQAIHALTQTFAQQHQPDPTSLPHALPFEVIALEHWNGQPFVRIADPHRPMAQLLTLYESQGDWQLTHIHSKRRSVRFQSTKNQDTREVILP